MCTNVNIGADDFDTVGELRAKLGCDLVHNGEPNSPECCLCGVDVPASAKRAGYRSRRNPFGYSLWLPKPKTKRPENPSPWPM